MITRRDFIKQALTAGAALPFLFSACQQSDYSDYEDQKLKKKVIILGIDGFDPAVIRAMIKKGRLPNFAALADTGTFSSLHTSCPPQSPVAWSSLATGNNPGKHGLFDFLRRDPRSYLPDLGIFQQKTTFGPSPAFICPLRSPPLWEILEEKGIPATVLKWPVTFPPAKSAANILCGLGTPDITGGLGAYTYYTTRRPGTTEEGREKVVTIEFSGNTAETEIYGPLVKGASDPERSGVPLTIQADEAQKKVTLSVQGRKYTLPENHWTPWIEMQFRVGLVKKISAIGRFYLNRITAPFSLYLSPLQINPAAPCFPLSQPANYAPFLQSRLGYFHTLGIPEDTKALTENRIDDNTFIEMCETIIREQEAMFWHELERFQGGLFAFVFFTTDRIQHIYWGTRDPRHPAYDETYAGQYQAIIEGYYRRMDENLGKLRRKLERDTLLIVCSDHGFTSFRKAVHINSWLVRNGFMKLHSPPLPSDKEGGALFAYVDWSQTSAYAVGLNGIYINLAGRESKGAVQPSEYEKVVQKIKQEIENFTDPDSGQNVVITAYPSQDIYHGQYISAAPDLVLGFNRNYRMSWQSAIGGTPPSLLEENTGKWTGDHCVDPSVVPGILFSNRKLHTDNCRVTDIAPTVLDYFDLSSADMDGQSLL